MTRTHPFEYKNGCGRVQERTHPHPLARGSAPMTSRTPRVFARRAIPNTWPTYRHTAFDASASRRLSTGALKLKYTHLRRLRGIYTNLVCVRVCVCVCVCYIYIYILCIPHIQVHIYYIVLSLSLSLSLTHTHTHSRVEGEGTPQVGGRRSANYAYSKYEAGARHESDYAYAQVYVYVCVCV
jgi:hypothetical protein